ncbi:MAG: nucleoside triphosphate pyrophosphohydrolase [Steroidobacteraceae bacterium]|jgi:nucleoside triphosphate diphosphatase
MTASVAALLEIMERLRSADGCPWDREQTFASIAPYTIEEAYEVADAIDRSDLKQLKDELGDLLFQVVFHAQMARERGEFDFEAVAAAICDKLVRRHPHVFGGAGALTAAEQSVAWENIKARESPRDSALDGVPRAMPALMRAFKLSKRAARVGFDFEHHGQTADKVAEELAEVREAAAALDSAAAPAGPAAAGPGTAPDPAAPSAEIFEEIGDLLFAAANLARKLDVDAEAALRQANDKFERRFRAMEALAASRDERFAGLNLAAQERLWSEVKRAE